MKITGLRKILIISLLLSSSPLWADEKISSIEHTGLEQTRKETVESRLENRKGFNFSLDKWIEERNILMDMDIFADVQLDIEHTDEGTNLTYSYKELPSFLFFPAMKRTDQDGLMIGPGVTFLNIGGLGIQQEIMSRYTVAPEFLRAKEALSYTGIPEIMGIPLSAAITLNYFESYNALKLYDENSFYSQISFLYSLSKKYKIVTTLSSFTVRHDDDNLIFQETEKEMPMFQGKGDWDFLPSAGAGFIIDTRERRMNPHSGIYNEYKVSIYGEKLGGDSDFMEYVWDFRGYLPAGEKHILHTNILARYRPGTIPAYELYHVGGVNSLRAYEPDPSICGQHEVLATLEYRYELFTNRQISLFGMHGYYGLQLVAGFDNAMQWLHDDSIESGTYYNSFFTGFHLLVPALERVRFEMGFSGFRNEEYSFKFGANIGIYEKAYTQRRRIR